MHKSDRKTEIVNIASKLFRERGYSAVTMRDIAQAMDIKAASLYNHIKSKQEILSLMIISIAEEYTATINEIVNSDASAIEKLERVVKLHVDITVRNPDALASLNNDWMHLDKSDLAYFLQMREEYEEKFRSIITKGIADKEVKNLNREVVIFSVLSTLRTLYLWYGKRPGFSEANLHADLPQILLRGII